MVLGAVLLLALCTDAGKSQSRPAGPTGAPPCSSGGEAPDICEPREVRAFRLFTARHVVALDQGRNLGNHGVLPAAPLIGLGHGLGLSVRVRSTCIT